MSFYPVNRIITLLLFYISILRKAINQFYFRFQSVVVLTHVLIEVSPINQFVLLSTFRSWIQKMLCDPKYENKTILKILFDPSSSQNTHSNPLGVHFHHTISMWISHKIREVLFYITGSEEKSTIVNNSLVSKQRKLH